MRTRRGRRALSAGGAWLVVTLGFWAIWSLQQKAKKEEVTRDVGPRQFAEPLPAGSGEKPQDRWHEIAQLETVTIELPLMRRGSEVAASRIILPRGRLLFEIHLPNASPEGNYKLRIVDKSGKTQKATEGKASTENQVTKLKVAWETSDLSPGDYTLGVLDPGFDEWVDYQLIVK